MCREKQIVLQIFLFETVPPSTPREDLVVAYLELSGIPMTFVSIINDDSSGKKTIELKVCPTMSFI